MPDVEFGYFLIPDASDPQGTVGLAKFADELGLDLLGVQDHPYQPRFLDTWTLLSHLAARTERIRLFPDVTSLPLRPPAVLARAAASLDILSGGRFELGLGAGAFWEAIEAMDGPRREPREAVAALAEAIGVIRALWTPGRGARLDGEHYRLRGAKPGPFPVHDIGIWVGAYKPRMLSLIGRLADGWIPSTMYVPPAELAKASRIIDAAAEEAGRDPAAIRRIYNISGRFGGSGGGFLQGPPRVWAEQLTELALADKVSGFVLATGDDTRGELRRFAEEVAPAVRAAVPSDPPGDPPGGAGSEPARERISVIDDASRPRLPKRPGGASASGRGHGQDLVRVHEHLRQELAGLRDAIAQVAAGELDPGVARSVLNRLTMRQNYLSIGAFCASYCRVVTMHHSIEDQVLFTSLRAADESLAPVLDRLAAEHDVIAGILDRVDKELVAYTNDPTRIGDLRREVDTLADGLLSHLAYEEEQLVEPMGRLGI
ncbi:LLM class flavin-dependent oxidoreductase [Phytohabitans kaempferiae]|uniref:LLM class flavin-dependent oxidoreductase n=1 Tax=Phytohabitans kaempferiae TaxID=1620943 RepID=A0ABV6M6L0_9ACTN